MAFTRLTIRFGGLCMFVQRQTDPAGLYVLLPDLKMAGMRHCALIQTLPENTPGGKAMRFPFDGQVADFFALKASSGKVGRLDWVADVSTYTNGERIADRWFTEPPRSHLTARVRLPLGLTPARVGLSGKLDIDGVPDPARKFGKADVVIDLDRPDTPLPNLPLPGVTLTPDANGAITIAIFNVRLAELDFGQPCRHHHGELLHHTMAYYKLLENHGSIHEPVITAGEDFPGDPCQHPDKPCLKDPQEVPFDDVDVADARRRDAYAEKNVADDAALRGPFSRVAIDPYNCTLGGGCPPSFETC